MIDHEPTTTQFKIAPGLTQVKILDFDFVHFINFQAEIHFPEEEGIVQIENFGIHLNGDGTIIYGLFVEGVLQNTSDQISIDHLTRLLVDVHQDSSKIMNDLLSQYQIQLLEMLYMNDVIMRSKFNCIIAESISPKLKAEDYLDRGEYENELKQILGDIHSAHDLSKDDIIIMGSTGILVVGPHSQYYESILTKYLSLQSREIFLRNYFVRSFILSKNLLNIRESIIAYKSDPNSIVTIRSMLNQATKDIVLLKELLEYLKESMEDIKSSLSTMPLQTDSGANRYIYNIVIPFPYVCMCIYLYI